MQTGGDEVVSPPAAAAAVGSRPRRSTTKRVDYAHPDAATVAAEVDDAEARAAVGRRTSGKAIAT